MSYINSKTNTNNQIKLFYEDLGEGKPVVLIHGWPLSHEMWEYQLNELPKFNIRCIAYDRRGFGRSDKPWNSYNYDILAQDLDNLLEELNLHDVTLVGFSMGGGEVVRYLTKYGYKNRVSKAVLVSSVIPFLLKTDDNPDGVSAEQIEKFEQQILEDRPAFMASFAKQFYGDSLLNPTVSKELLDWNQNLVLQASGYATISAMHSWAETDFREEVKNIKIPVLIIHGSADKTVPINISSDKTANLLPNAEYIVYEGSPHGLFITDKENLNQHLISFINSDS